MKIFKSKTKILLTYDYSTKEINRICGHTFEVFEYYMFLNELGYDVSILIQDKINKEKIFGAFNDKYDYKKDLKIFFVKHPDKVVGKTIIVTNGVSKNIYVSKNIISFRCSQKILNIPNIHVLQDNRIYNDTENYFHYVKKFYFKSFKKIVSKKDTKNIMIYVNNNLRKISEKEIKYINKNFIPSDLEDHKFLFIVANNITNEYKNMLSKYGEIKIAPVKNIFEQFNVYLYTGIDRKFDCSPRLLTESFYYGKRIIFNFNFDEYTEYDKGLYWRWYDINNDFKSLELTENDDILKYLDK